jgi:uncharacterized protein YwqG
MEYRFKKTQKWLDDDEFEDLTLPQIEQAFRDAAAPAIQLVEAEASNGLSKFGGLPDVAARFAWPHSNDRPLSFVGQIDLSLLPRSHLEMPFPNSGLLYFFYTQKQYTASFDPASRSEFRVIYSPISTGLIRADTPTGMDFGYLEKRLAFRPILSIPSGQRLYEYGSPDDTWEMQESLQKEIAGGKPQHQIGGYPDPIQNDNMEEESQLASNGVYCGIPEDWKTAKALKLRESAADWRLLLQLDDDPEAGMFWFGGGSGRIYYWIREQDLAATNFSNVWVVSQWT